MEQHKIEYNENSSLPIYLNQSYIRGPGILTKTINKCDPPINNVTEYYSNGVIKFELNSTNFMDPFSLFLELTIENNSNFPIQIDNSIHSLIKKIEVRYKKNNKILEQIVDYDILSSIYFDLHLSKEERIKRRKYEGFGYNEFGSNEVVIPNLNFRKEKLADLDIDRIEVEPDFQNNKNTLKNYKIDNDFFTDIIKPKEEWNHTKNGILRPEKFDSEKIPAINERTFKIPLMLKLIGHGIQPDNFKYVPLEIIGPVYIIISLNQHAFFKPALIKKRTFSPNTFANYGFNRDEKISFIVKNVKLHYQLIEFPQKIKNELYSQVKNNSWYVDYIGLAYINHFYIFKLPCQDGISEFREQTEIRAMHIFFLTNLFEKSIYSRPLSRRNIGIKRIELIWNNMTIPEVIEDHNSFNTDTEDDLAINVGSANFFWEQLKQSFENVSFDENNPMSMPILTKQNFCIKNSFSEIMALCDLADLKGVARPVNEFDVYDKDWLKKYSIQNDLNKINRIEKKNGFDKYNSFPKKYECFDGFLTDFQNKSIFTFCFDNMPYAYRQYRNGLKVKDGDKFKIRITRINDFLNYENPYSIENIYSYMYVYVEYYETALLSYNGEFYITK